MRKVFMRDSSVFHALIGIQDINELLLHPKLGASWECFALDEIIRFHKADPEECYFWVTHQQAELDLMIVKNGKLYDFEIKYSSSPKARRSMRIAIDDLKLDSYTIIYRFLQRCGVIWLGFTTRFLAVAFLPPVFVKV